MAGWFGPKRNGYGIGPRGWQGWLATALLLGGAVLCWTAYSMIVREPMLVAFFEAHPASKLVLAVLAFSIALAPWYAERLSPEMKPLTVLLPALLIWMLGFEIASSVWKVQVDYLLATNEGEYLLEGLRWIGWLPLLAKAPMLFSSIVVRPPAKFPGDAEYWRTLWQ